MRHRAVLVLLTLVLGAGCVNLTRRSMGQWADDETVSNVVKLRLANFKTITRSKTLPEPGGAGEKLVDAVHARIGDLQPPSVAVASHGLVGLEVADRLAVEHREALAQAGFERDRSAPPFRDVRPRQPGRDQRQIGCRQRPQLHHHGSSL